MLLYLNYDAATADTERAQLATEALKGEAKARASLEYLAICLGHTSLDKTYQKPHNWCVTTLSPEHHRYVLGDIEVPVEILKHIFGTTDSTQILEHIQEEYPWYLDFAKAAFIVISSKGVPYSDTEAAKVAAGLADELAATVEQLKQWPEFFGEAIRILADPRKGISAELVVKAVEAHATKNGLLLPRTEAGKVSLASKAMKFAGLTEQLPCWPSFESIQKLKKALSTIEQFRSHARVDGRIHSLVAFTTAAGRMSCSEPNVQGTPCDSKLRALIAAKEFHTLVWADYSAIELRIASANAERAIRNTRRRLKNGGNIYNLPFFLRSCAAARRKKSDLAYPTAVDRPEDCTEDDWRMQLPGHKIMYFAQRTLRQKEQNLTRVFRLRVDPHLVTGLTMARIAGNLPFEGDIIQWLSTRTQDEIKRLKEQFADQWQQAKAVNFGLLYGMGAETLHRYGITNYGCQWSLEQAVQARDAWFQLFPELGFWHQHTKYASGHKLLPDEVVVWNKYTQQIEKFTYGAKLYKTSTLTGRPLLILHNLTDALSYQGQGTGACILTRAIASMSDRLSAAFILPVHDEIVLEVPANEAESYKAELVETMVKAAEQVLGGVVPVEVEAQIGPVWKK